MWGVKTHFITAASNNNSCNGELSKLMASHAMTFYYVWEMGPLGNNPPDPPGKCFNTSLASPPKSPFTILLISPGTLARLN